MSVPNARGGGRADTSAGTLAEAGTNASQVLGVLLGCWPGSVHDDIGIEVHVDPDIAERLESARNPSEAAEVLRGGGLRDDDVTAIVWSQATSAMLPSPPAVRAAAELLSDRLDVPPAAGSRDGTEEP